MPFDLPPQLEAFYNDANKLWQAGGWAMIAIAAVALIMFTVGMKAYITLLDKRFELSWRSGLMIAIFVLTIGGTRFYYLNKQGDPESAKALADGEITQAQHDANLQALFDGLLLEIFVVFLPIALALGALRVAISSYSTRGCRHWPDWLNHPEKRKGPVGNILNFVSGGNTVEETAIFFEEVHSTEVKPTNRELIVMRICVAAAPLLGLLGTVTGMIATFQGLMSGSGGDKTKDLVADGISEALITTETGLVVALSGLFFQYMVSRKFERYKAFLAHMESVCNQKLHNDEDETGTEPATLAKAA